jgi:hypothetical protein
VAGQPEGPGTIDFGRFKVVRHRRELLADGLPVELGGRAFEGVRLIKGGESAAGSRLLSEALARAEQTEERWCLAELLRAKGELHLLERLQASGETAEKCFHRALDLARDQGALSWVLRAAMSLARLWQKLSSPQFVERGESFEQSVSRARGRTGLEEAFLQLR